eukprot:COSAG05_NODE_75_length_21588_cov_303.091438_9_plen_127_part_00
MQVITESVQKAMGFLGKTEDVEKQLELLETLRTVTEGKIFVEMERARLTRTLVGIKEAEGKVEEACEILQEVQVETIGTMDKREKTSYILDQMRLCLAKGGAQLFCPPTSYPRHKRHDAAKFYVQT